MNRLSQHLPRPLVFYDIGARGGIERPWEAFREVIEVVSFEPDRDEYELLLKNKKPNEIIYPYALYRENETILFHLTKSRGCSSLYEPDLDFLQRYSGVERFSIDRTVRIEAVSLDSLSDKPGIRKPDFIKVDVQGAELAVLEGGLQLLGEHVLGVEVEVEFHQLYKNQPVFADVDSFIRQSLGLELFDLSKAYWKYKDGIRVGGWKGQLMFGNALYLRPPDRMLPFLERFDAEQAYEKLTMLFLIAIRFGYFDYCLCLLKQPQLQRYLTAERLAVWEGIVASLGKALYSPRAGPMVARIGVMLNLLARALSPIDTHGRVSEGSLGSSKKFGLFR